jgi:hypothetical protein
MIVILRHGVYGWMNPSVAWFGHSLAIFGERHRPGGHFSINSRGPAVRAGITLHDPDRLAQSHPHSVDNQSSRSDAWPSPHDRLQVVPVWPNSDPSPRRGSPLRPTGVSGMARGTKRLALRPTLVAFSRYRSGYQTEVNLPEMLGPILGFSASFPGMNRLLGWIKQDFA